ncbi:MAG: hypothetical protein Q4C66_04190 [Lachnospiraceae bacterium]|nr:hypothetical protein [Lachnospiraceae bacterium]
MVIVEVYDGKRRKLVPLTEAVSSNGIANMGKLPLVAAHIAPASTKRQHYHQVREKLEEYQDAYDKAYGTVAVSRREDKEAFLRISRSLG